VWGQFTVMVNQRDAVQAALRDDGIPTAVHYPVPLHQQPAYVAYGAAGGVSERVAQRVLSLPMSADLAESDQDRVVAALAAAVDALA
jgi:UDP-2-acetamido-2-deoxy-ribo-hexuluronate aminotransferase